MAFPLSATLLAGAIGATAQPLPCASVAPEVRQRVQEAGACREATPADVALKGAAPPSSAVTMKLSDGTVVRVPREISSSINDARKRATTRKAAARESIQSEPGSPLSQHVFESSPAGTADTTAVTAAAAPSTPAPAADSAPSSAADPAPASEPTQPPASRGRSPAAFSANAALILGAAVSLGLLLGALSMRPRLLRRAPAADENGVPPPLSQQQAVETSAGGISETEAAPEIRFAARLEPGETTIVLSPLADDGEVALEYSSDDHA